MLSQSWGLYFRIETFVACPRPWNPEFVKECVTTKLQHATTPENPLNPGIIFEDLQNSNDAKLIAEIWPLSADKISF